MCLVVSLCVGDLPHHPVLLAELQRGVLQARQVDHQPHAPVPARAILKHHRPVGGGGHQVRCHAPLEPEWCGVVVVRGA